MGFFDLKTIGVAAVVALLAFGLHSLVAWRTDFDHKAELLAQEARLTQECENQKKLTREMTNDLLQKNKTLASRVADFNRRARMQPEAACIPIQGGPASGSNAATGNQGFLGGSGISSEWLADFARRCEAEALKLDSLQEWVRQTGGGG